MDDKDFLEMKSKLEAKKNKKMNLEGKRDSLFEQLKETCQCDTLDDAQEKLLTLKSNLTQCKQQYEEKKEEIKNKYPWDE